MRPSFPELMYGLFWLALTIFLILFAMRAFSMMDALEKRMQQTTLLTARLVEQANTGLKDHERFLAQHDAIMQRPWR
jgi:Tfp pilus assembly protein PilX